MHHIEGLRDIAGKFELILVDQFGVLHNGVSAYPGAPQALAALAAQGCQVIVLSNSGKRAAPNEARLVSLGITRTSFQCVVSSGEVALELVTTDSLGEPFRAGRRMYTVGRTGETYALCEPLLVAAPRPDVADFIMIAGSNAPKTSLDEYRKLLAPATRRGVPALCINPDLTMLLAGALAPAPGAIAAIYQELGGQVCYVGKPHGAIYEHARRLATGADQTRILVVGDSPAHDIAGGKAMGFKTLLVRSGVHAELDEASLLSLCEAHGGLPDFLAPGFFW